MLAGGKYELAGVAAEHPEWRTYEAREVPAGRAVLVHQILAPPSHDQGVSLRALAARCTPGSGGVLERFASEGVDYIVTEASETFRDLRAALERAAALPPPAPKESGSDRFTRVGAWRVPGSVTAPLPPPKPAPPAGPLEQAPAASGARRLHSNVPGAGPAVPDGCAAGRRPARWSHECVPNTGSASGPGVSPSASRQPTRWFHEHVPDTCRESDSASSRAAGLQPTWRIYEHVPGAEAGSGNAVPVCAAGSLGAGQFHEDVPVPCVRESCPHAAAAGDQQAGRVHAVLPIFVRLRSLQGEQSVRDASTLRALLRLPPPGEYTRLFQMPAQQPGPTPAGSGATNVFVTPSAPSPPPAAPMETGPSEFTRMIQAPPPAEARPAEAPKAAAPAPAAKPGMPFALIVLFTALAVLAIGLVLFFVLRH